MSGTMLTAAVFAVCCAGISYTGFCRLAHTSKSTTAPAVSGAIYGLTVAAMFGVFSVVLWGYIPDLPSTALAAGVLAVQMATSRAWRHGLPEAYRRHPT
jgi:hypothetical protein